MTTLSTLAARAAVAALTLAPALAGAQVAPPGCGASGTAPCPTPEPGSWPLVALALGVLVAVKFIKRK
ncbi:MAG TPA: PEP-CTERM sorting domain-containing protein [Roseateles sp.]